MLCKGRIRETVEERIERISAPDKKSANETALVSMKIDPSERFYDFERGVFLHPLLREANMKRRMKREPGDRQNHTLIPMRNVRAKNVNMKVQGKSAGGIMNGQASNTLENEDSDEALERVLDYTRHAKRKQILEAKVKFPFASYHFLKDPGTGTRKRVSAQMRNF